MVSVRAALYSMQHGAAAFVRVAKPTEEVKLKLQFSKGNGRDSPLQATSTWRALAWTPVATWERRWLIWSIVHAKVTAALV